MALLHVRSLLPFQPGANTTDVVINEVHFNLTALDYYNYTLYSNGTLSNDSQCYLAFNQYQPHMFSNGTFLNATSCYTPVFNIGRRGSVGLAFGLLFALSTIFTVTNIRKHGRAYLPLDKRWSPMGRRWKWYWLLFLAAFATISCFMSIDVDRYYLQSLPLILQSIFYTILTPMLMAAVWEAVRHWGAWQERQVCDRDPLAFTEPGNFNSREKQELCLPLLFYSFACLNFFLTIPRSWTPIQLQRSPDQLLSQALPTATDARFKAAAITAIAGVLVICYSLEHSIYRYIARPADRIRMRTFYLVSAPSQFVVAIAILSVKVGYGIASAFAWTVSPLNANVNPAWLYGLGYTPILLIIMLFNLCGLCDLNEDKTLLLLRGDRVAPKKCKLERKLPVWLNSGRWEIFKHSTRSKRDDGDGDDVERFVEMGIIKPEDEPKGVAGGSDISTTADPDPFSDTAGFSIDIDDIVGRLERDDEGRVHESTSETMIDETQTMRNMLV